MSPTTVWVGIASAHNVAELRALRTLRPDHAYLVTSQQPQITARAQRLKALWEAAPSSPRLEIVGESTLSGDSYQGTRAWFDQCLRPRLQAHQQAGATLTLDVTGGTKVMAMALKDAFEWSHVHYVPFGGDTPEELMDSTHAPLALASISPLEQAQLYESVQAASEPTPPSAAQMHWDQQIYDQHLAWSQGLGPGPHRTLLAAFHRADEQGRNKEESESASDSETATLKPAGTAAWFTDLFQALDASEAWTVEGDEITIPRRAFRPKSNPDRKLWRWLQGEWLEHAGWQWLTHDLGLPTGQVTHSLTYNDHQDNAQAELDLVFQYQRRLHVLEAKAGLPPNAPITPMVDKLFRASQALGMVRAGFLLAPSLQHTIKSADWKRLKRQSKLRQVALITTPEELRQWVGS